MMIADRFHAMASLRDWNAEKKAAVLLDYVVRRRDDAAFLTFLAQQEIAHPAMTWADAFLWAVVERLQRPALALDARFQLFRLDTFDLFTPDEAGAEWQRRTAL